MLTIDQQLPSAADLAPPMMPPKIELSTLYGGELPSTIRAVAMPTLDANIDLRAIELESIPKRTGYHGLEETLPYLGSMRAASTYLVYDRVCTMFVRWCAQHHVDPLEKPEAVVARFLAMRASEDGVEYTSCKRDLAALEALYVAIGVGRGVTAHWLVRSVLKGIGANGKTPRRRMRAMLPNYVLAALSRFEEMAQREPVRAARNLSILTMGLATAFRRIELCSLDTEDIEVFEQGVRVRLRKSKTRGRGDAHVVEVFRVPGSPICPVMTLLNYADVARLDRGPLYRGTYPSGKLRETRIADDAVGRIVRETAAWLGMDGNWGAHSLRVGSITAMYENGASTAQIAKISDHASEAQLLNYVRPETPFAVDHTGKIFG